MAASPDLVAPFKGLALGSERFAREANSIVHHLEIGNIYIQSSVAAVTEDDEPKDAWWRAYLSGQLPSAHEPTRGELRVVDLFCGAGGMANGIRHLAGELGLAFVSELVVDQDEAAAVVYAANHGSRRRVGTSVRNLVDYSVRHAAAGAIFAYRPTLMDAELVCELSGVDLVLAGPPCQGHSNLNNQTRRADPRNSLYLSVPAFAVAIGSPTCIIENVPAVVNDRSRVVQVARELFESEGYHVETGLLSAMEMGWPQDRRRHFLVARRDRAPIPLKVLADILHDTPRSLWWAIGDLERHRGKGFMDETSALSDENRARIDWLFDNEAYELALKERPKSHRGGTTYTSVYGRLRKDRPAPTITTGFMTPGRGRYTHPSLRRVLTPREAARLQGFPDTYRFDPNPADPPCRAQLAKWIGDAVPMPLGYGAALSALAPGIPLRREG